MHSHHGTHFHVRELALFLGGVLLCSAAGCQKSEEIRTYEVPKAAKATPAQPAQSAPGRMLGGIILQGPQAWFFKMSGPDAQVQDQMEEFLALCKSIRFENGKPTWTLPDGWSEKPGSEMRFATLKVDDAKPPLETSVIVLPKGDDSDDEYLLANINRWRGQLQLPPTTADKLFEESSKKVEVIRDKTNAGDELVLVNLVGMLSDQGGMSPPFASRSGPFSGPTSPGPVGDKPSSPDNADPGVKYDLPKNWEQAELKTFQVAAFRARKDDQRVEISITPIGGGGGGLLANVNRWRGQIKLPPIDESEMNAAFKQLTVGEMTAQYIELVGPETEKPQQAIWSAILEHAGQTWFIKLQGDLDLAREEQPRFEDFVKSIRFE